MPGPFFFAWIDSAETFGVSHEREDEQIFALTIEQAEGEFASAMVDVLNPRIGLLNAGRKQWAIISWDTGDTAGIIPLFKGRLVGVPQDLQAEVVRLEFVARPSDWNAQRAALAETLRVAPYWDPIWFEPERLTDPDAVLEARSQLWHTDRVTNVVTVSDIMSGEDGTIALGGDYFYDSLSVSPGEVAARRVMIDATVGWDQAAAGRVDLTKKLLKAAKQADSGDGKNIDTYTGDGLATDWPKKGDDIGAGWKVGTSYVRRGDGKWTPKDPKRVVFSNGLIADFPQWKFKPQFEVRYDISRSRSEKVSFTLTADVQALKTDPGDEEVILISTTSAQLNEPLDPDATITTGFAPPIGDARRRSYFQTPRGHRSIEWLICLARARLLDKARAVDVKVKTSWAHGVAAGLSCRKSLSVADDRLPGGAAIGKIVGYTLSFSGDGSSGCDIQIACAVGNANSIVPDAGTPSYVVTGYVDAGYQVYAGATLSTAVGDVTYTPPDGTATPDDGVDFFRMTPDRVATNIEIIDGKPEQEEVLESFLPDVQAALDALNQVFTEIRVDLVPLNTGPFETDYTLVVSSLMIPRGIDLEAAAL